mmetsp:Transcript_71/g.274  ORF Transcript_71/g.274 Transcript_71/m.274 type:complete len:348 (-) Transcript_71:2748-3791(-)
MGRCGGAMARAGRPIVPGGGGCRNTGIPFIPNAPGGGTMPTPAPMGPMGTPPIATGGAGKAAGPTGGACTAAGSSPAIAPEASARRPSFSAAFDCSVSASAAGNCWFVGAGDGHSPESMGGGGGACCCPPAGVSLLFPPLAPARPLPDFFPSRLPPPPLGLASLSLSFLPRRLPDITTVKPSSSVCPMTASSALAAPSPTAASSSPRSSRLLCLTAISSISLLTALSLSLWALASSSRSLSAWAALIASSARSLFSFSSASRRASLLIFRSSFCLLRFFCFLSRSWASLISSSASRRKISSSASLALRCLKASAPASIVCWWRGSRRPCPTSAPGSSQAKFTRMVSM